MPAQTSAGLAMGTPKTPLSHHARLLLAFGLPSIVYQLGKAVWDERFPAPADRADDLALASYNWTAPPLPPLDGPTKAALVLTAVCVTFAVAWTISLALERLSLDVRGEEDRRLRLYEWALIGIWSLFVVPAALQPGVQGLLVGLLGA